jgi:hypothetical protein
VPPGKNPFSVNIIIKIIGHDRFPPHLSAMMAVQRQITARLASNEFKTRWMEELVAKHYRKQNYVALSLAVG